NFLGFIACAPNAERDGQSSSVYARVIPAKAGIQTQAAEIPLRPLDARATKSAIADFARICTGMTVA
ncbi:MAG: hypothetical protein KDJ40_07015, partial [Hyphomicrobiales bacterium]|nr:hypothetical protein [Hyphomicrobiales bacterium]